jgi:hypothetical protein
MHDEDYDEDGYDESMSNTFAFGGGGDDQFTTAMTV